MSGSVSTMPTTIATMSSPMQMTALTAAAPSSKPTSPRRHPIPHVRHVSCLANQPMKNARRPPHQGHRRRTPRHSIVGNDGRALMTTTPRLRSRSVPRAVIRETAPMRRGLAGLLFTMAAMCLALAAGGWWLQRIAFSGDAIGGVADVVVSDSAIRTELASTIADATARELGVGRGELRRTLDEYLRADSPETADVLERVVTESHARLIGLRDEPVQITSDEIVSIVRDERAAVIPAVTIPVEKVGVLSTIRVVLGWFVPLAAIAGALALLLGIVAHPRKADAAFGIGVFCLVAAVAAVLLGYVVPAYVVPEVTDNPWVGVIPEIAKDAVVMVIVVAVVLAVAGLALTLGAAAARRRKVWSQPVAVHRYADQRRWS